VFYTDLFAIRRPGATANETVFGIGPVDGSTKAVLLNTLFEDGKIWTRHIGARQIDAINMKAKSITAANGAIDNLAVNTLQIADQAVIVPVFATFSGPLAGDNTYQSCIDRVFTFAVPPEFNGKTLTAVISLSAIVDVASTEFGKAWVMQLYANNSLLHHLPAVSGRYATGDSMSATGVFNLYPNSSGSLLLRILVRFYSPDNMVSLSTATAVVQFCKR
jgi:hypothetical protein